jgi:hypothetical protein
VNRAPAAFGGPHSRARCTLFRDTPA